MNKNISKPNIGENLSPHKHQSSVVNISKPLEDILSELCLDFDSDDYFNTIEEVKEDEDFKQSLEKIQEIINQAILNERTKTLEMLKDEPIEKVKILHESARRGYYIRTKDAGAYARNKFRRNLRDKIKENYD